MRKEITILLTVFTILFSTMIPGVYAMEDDEGMDMPQMDADQMQEMTLEMIENSIDSLTTLQSELDDEDLLDSVDSLLEQMESLKTELEATDDEDEITEIMEEYRSSMEEAPEEVREALMQNGPMAGEGQGPMDGNGTMMEEGEAMQAPEGESPGNESRKGEAPSSNPDDADTISDDETSDSTSESTGLLSGLINAIKSLF